MVELKATTEFGQLVVTPTEAKHIFLRTADDEPLTINGVKLNGSAHMYKWEDGKWHIGPEFDSNGNRKTLWQARMDGLYFRKYGVFDYNKQHMSDSQSTKLCAMLETFTELWARSNEAVLQQAELNHMNDELQKMNEKREAIELELNNLVDAINTLENERDDYAASTMQVAQGV